MNTPPGESAAVGGVPGHTAAVASGLCPGTRTHHIARGTPPMAD
jgi:hypothetical protein